MRGIHPSRALPSSLLHSATLYPGGQAITNLTGFPVECASLPPAWQVEARLINDQAGGVWCDVVAACAEGWKTDGASGERQRKRPLRVAANHFTCPALSSSAFTRVQVYCGWGSSACVLRAGQKVYLPPDASAARAGGNGSIQ